MSRRSLFILSFFLLIAAIVYQWPSQTSAQSAQLRVPIKVSNAGLPATVGVPLGEAARITDTSRLAVLDPQGQPVPSQFRVLARWRGAPTDATIPVKWVLVDFKPSTSGEYTLVQSPKAAPLPAFSVAESANAINLTTSRLDLNFPKQGQSLLAGFKLDGAETLSAPLTVQITLPRGGIVVMPPTAGDTLTLNDASLLGVGEVIRFEQISSLKWEAAAGSTKLYPAELSLLGAHQYLLDEGTARQEQVSVTQSDPGVLTTGTPLKFTHPVGCRVRDLTVEQETATLSAINNQQVRFSAPLKQTHGVDERIYASQSALAVTASALVTKTTLEESNSLRAVVRQDGYFSAGGVRVGPTVNFTLRYYVYADQPFVRVRLRLNNEGTYGFGASRLQQPPYAQHALIRSLSAIIPTVAAGAGAVSVLDSSEAAARLGANQGSALLAAGAFELAVPEFAENYPKAITASKDGLRFDLLPGVGLDHVFDGGRSKTTDFYLGRSTERALALTDAMNGALSPAYVAQTGAVRPALVEKRNWSAVFASDPQMAEAATRAERLFACSYAVEASEGANAVPAESVYEYRLRGENGEHFGWRNFGDLAWGDGYSNLHYDLPYLLLREFLRTGDGRAFQIGSEMARYRSDWGQYHADDYWDAGRTWNLRGLAFYEKGDHGSYREPVPSHTWIEGLWLYWALTGDEAVRQSAVEAADALARFQFTYDNALSWNEPRWVGWPVLALMAAWRYSGNTNYLLKAKENAYLIVTAEENYGKKGYFIPPGSGIGVATQPFMWGGYAQLGIIEYWRETGDQRVADYLVRVADWVLGKASPFPALTGGQMLTNGTYQPLGSPYFWYPDHAASDRTLALGMMSLPVLTAAARITNRADLRAQARALFRDVAYYRDTPDGVSLSPSSRATINFRSLLFAASSPKVYGQTGLVLADYLPDLLGSVVLPPTAPTRPSKPTSPTPSPSPTPTPTPTPAPTPTPSPTPRSTPVLNTPPPAVTPPANLPNLALGKPATASSFRNWWGDMSARSAVDGNEQVMWHSDSNLNQLEYLQVDLGGPAVISRIEIVFRRDQDQPNTRQNFAVYASNDPTFMSGVTLLGKQGNEVYPLLASPWSAGVTVTPGFRYVRFSKTAMDRDVFGQYYWNLNEVRVFGSPAK